MVDTIAMKHKMKCIGGILGQLCDFDLIHDIAYEVFKIKFWNSSLSRIVGLMDVKQKGHRSRGYWTNYVSIPLTTPMTLTLNFKGQNLK